MHLQEKADNLAIEASNNLESAKKLIDKERVLHGLFYCHLVIQKILRAIVIKNTNASPSKTMDLNSLLAKANIKLSKENISFIEILINFHIQGRYPSINQVTPNSNIGNDYILQTEALYNTLKEYY